MIFKKLFAPTGQQKELDAIETYSVRWVSRYGKFHGDTREEAEFFTSKDNAIHFAEQLREAFKLIRHTSRTYVVVEKTKAL